MKTKLLLLLLLANFSIYAQTANVPAYVPKNGLIAYYPFNGNANDESGNTNNGTIKGASLTPDRLGNANSAYNFDGLTNYIDATISQIPQSNASRTISGWFQTNTPNFSENNQACIFNYGTVSKLQRFSLCIYSKGYLETVNGPDFSDDDFYVNNSDYLNNNWYFFTLTYDGNKVSLYVNGINISQKAVSLTTANNLFRIGKRISGDATNEYFKGKIDDIGIWNRVLTPEEISALYTPGKPEIAYTLIPDANFEKKLIELGIDSGAIDGKVPTENIASVRTLDLSSSSISNLSGIEDFKNVDVLYFNSNLLTNVDLSKNNKLFIFYGRDNKLTSINLPEKNQLYEIYLDRNNLAALDVSKCDSLRNLHAEDNLLTNLNLSKNKDLASLFLDRNKLTSLDISKNNVLKTVWCGENQLSSVILPESNNLDVLYLNDNKFTALDISKYTTLKEFVCSTNQLTNIDVSKNTQLTYFHCQLNNLTSLDITKNTGLTSVYCHDNKLKTLNVSQNKALVTLWCQKNQLTNLDVSQNTALAKLYCHTNNFTNLNVKNGNNANMNIYSGFINNAALTCIQVDNVNYANTNWTDKKDAAASYNTNCTIEYVLLPDNNFEQKLIDLGIDTDGLNGKITTADVSSITALDLSNSNIKNLAGIEKFTSLTSLDCNNNQLTNLDLSNNVLLETLNASSNQITSLDLSKNNKLTVVYVVLNPLVFLNLQNGNNKNITILIVTGKNTVNNIATTFLGLNKLSCIKVDDVAFSNANWSKIKESTTTYSTTCKNLGIEDNIFDKAVVYPNPTKGEVSISNITLEKATVYNTLGQLVKSFTLNSTNTNNTINLSGLPKGVYYVYLINEDAASVKKVIVE